MKLLSNARSGMLLTTATAALLSSYINTAYATEASPHLYEELTPDGELITLGIVGGPEGSVEVTTEGYSVVDCGPGKGKGYKCYATLNPVTGDVEATDLKVSNNAHPEKMGIAKGIHVGKTPFGLDKKDDRARQLNEGKTLEGVQSSRRAITTGTTKNLVIPIRFSDHTGRTLPSKADLEVLMNSDTTHSTLAPSGSVKKYFEEVSFNTLVLNSVVVDWVTVPNTEAYYANANRGLTTKTHEMIKAALDIVNQSVDFTEFDANNDNVIDVITFLHSGYGAEWGGTDAYGANYLDRIWSHKWAIYTVSDRSFDGITVYNYHISPAVWGTSGTAIGRIGVICHETGHFFGLPDLYDTSGTGDGIGSYGLMANSWGFDGSQKYPPNVSPWSKVQVGWLLPARINTITSGGNYEAFPAYTTGTHAVVYKITDGYASGEYLLIENRQKLGFDLKVPTEGLCIWHVDEAAGNNDEGYPGQAGWPTNGLHYKNALLQADGLYQMEKGQNRGNGGDVYAPGLSIGPSGADPTQGPFPNTDSYKGGNLVKTDITIDNIVANGDNFQFSVSFGETAAPTTASPTKSPTKSPSASPTLSSAPTAAPIVPPTATPTKSPTAAPTVTATSSPTGTPTKSPTAAPTVTASNSPTKTPTPPPTLKPDGSSCSSGSECQSGLCRTNGPASRRGCYSDGGGSCTLLASGSDCTSNNQCCSNKCKRNGRCS